MLSIDQRKAIFVAILKSYTIATKSFSTACIYTNQVMNKDNYPYIVLNYMDEETMYQNAVGDYLGNGTTGQRSTAMMSVNIYAKDAQGLNANQIAGGIALQLSQDIRENWKSLSSGTVRYIRKSPTRNLTSVMQSQGILDISRLQFDLILAYNLTW